MDSHLVANDAISPGVSAGRHGHDGLCRVMWVRPRAPRAPAVTSASQSAHPLTRESAMRACRSHVPAGQLLIASPASTPIFPAPASLPA